MAENIFLRNIKLKLVKKKSFKFLLFVPFLLDPIEKES